MPGMSSRRLAEGFGFTIVHALLLASTIAQAPKGPVRLVGRIVSVLHEGVPAAEVWVTDVGGRTLARTVADGDGYYQLHRLPGVPLQLHARGADKVEGSMAVATSGLVRATTLPLEDGDALRGVVKGADGTPVAGAGVMVTTTMRLEPPYDWCAETTTAADGSWSLPNAPLRALAVTAFVPGRPLAEVEVGEGRSGPVVVTMSAATIASRRVTVHGVPAGAVAVAWSDLGPLRAQTKRLPRAALEAAVDAEGRAQLWELPVKHEVRVRLAGHSSLPVYIPAAAAETRDLEFAVSALAADVVAPKTRLTGRLVDSVGVALAGVEILGKLDDVYAEPVTTAADGSFALDVPVRSGVLYRLALGSPGWRLGGDRAALDTDGLCWLALQVDPSKPVQLQAMPTGIVRSVLLGANGAPLAAVNLQLRLLPPDHVPAGRQGEPRVLVVAASDAAGRVDFPGLPAGSYQMQTVGAGGPPGSVEFRVHAAGTSTIGAITFQPVGEVRGVVTGPDGAPMAAAAFALIGQTAQARRLPAALRVQIAMADGGASVVLTDRRGRFRIPAIAAGTWALAQRLGTGAPGRARDVTTFDVEPGATVTCDLVGVR